jgi:hypothetical protein
VHGPHAALLGDRVVVVGCQSRVATTTSCSRAMRLIGSITSSPRSTASAPPGVKSFCTSTTMSASVSRI